MWKRILIGIAIIILSSGVLAWFNRSSILTHLVLNRAKAGHIEVGPHQPVEWQTGPATADQPISERPPNIVFILLDDFGINDLTAFGGGVADGRVPTPNIDRLAAQGAIYTQSYSGTGTCAPSRAMLMTGRYPTRTGFEFTPTPNAMGRVVSTIAKRHGPRCFTAHGVQSRSQRFATLTMKIKAFPDLKSRLRNCYKIEAITQYISENGISGGAGDFTPQAQGFDESLLMHSGLFLAEDDPNVVNAKLDFDPIDRFLWAAMQYAASFNGGAPFEPGGYLTDWWTDESLKVIEANKNRPFFLYLAHWAPHTPLQATQADYDAVGEIEPHRLRVYAAMIHALDRSVGRVMQKLEDEGLADNTIVVLSSDNGGAGYVGLPEINAPYRGWKITLFEGGIRVPMFIKWPARVAPGTVIDTPVAHIDLFPTLAAAAGADLPNDRVIDGRNILVEATGEGVIERPDDAIYWQSGFYKVVRAGDWKLQVNDRQDRSWLFNLATDPTEQNDLSDAEPDKAAELKALLAAHHADAVPSLYQHTIESPISIDKTLAEPFVKGDEYIIWPN